MARYPRPEGTYTPRSLSAGQLKVMQAVAILLEGAGTKITINNIAREIHVTEGAIYRHFRSKEDIFEAILTYMEANLLTPLKTVQEQSSDTERRLELVFNAINGFLEGHPGLARLLLGHGATEAAPVADKLKILNGKIRSEIIDMLKLGSIQGVLRAGLTAEQGGELFYGLLVGTAMAQAHQLPQLESSSRWKAIKITLFESHKSL